MGINTFILMFFLEPPLDWYCERHYMLREAYFLTYIHILLCTCWLDGNWKMIRIITYRVCKVGFILAQHKFRRFSLTE